MIDLEVAGVKDRARGRVDSDSGRVRDAMADGEPFDTQPPNFDGVARRY